MPDKSLEEQLRELVDEYPLNSSRRIHLALAVQAQTKRTDARIEALEGALREIEGALVVRPDGNYPSVVDLTDITRRALNVIEGVALLERARKRLGPKDNA